MGCGHNLQVPPDLSSEPQIRSSSFLPDKPLGGPTGPSDPTSQNSALVSTPHPRSLLVPSRCCGRIAPPTTQPSGQTSRDPPHLRCLPQLYAQMVAVTRHFFLLNSFQTCFSSPSLGSFELLLGLVQKSLNISSLSSLFSF